MDAVELPLPADIVTKLMRTSGCSGGGGVARVELLGSKSERETCSSSFHPDKDNNCNGNGSRTAFWNKLSDEDHYRQPGQTSIDHDMGSVPESKQSQSKSGKSSRSNGSSSRRSRVAHMEASMNVAGVFDVNDLPKDLGSYSGKYNITEKKQKSTVSGKRSDKRNGKTPKNKYDSFSVKAGLSSFSSAAGGNNILGAYGSKHEICDFEKHVDEVSLNELLDGSYKCRESIKGKENKTENLNENENGNGNILSSVREACSVLHLQKPIKTPTVQTADGSYNHNNSSCLPNITVSVTTTNDDNKAVAKDSSSCNKVESSSTGHTDENACILEFPLFAPKDVLERLALPPAKDLDLMLLDSMKPTSTSKVQNGGSLPTFPWSHVSGRDFKANPDVVKSTPSKSSCQGRWVKMGKSKSNPTATATTYLTDFESLTYNQSLVPLQCQQVGLIEKDKSSLVFVNDTTSGTRTIPSKSPAAHSSKELTAAQTLCKIAAQYHKQNQDGPGPARWQKKSSHKSIRTSSKFTSDEKLEKALFAIPSSRPVGPTNLINGLDDTKSSHTPKKVKLSDNEKNNNLVKGPFHWSTTTPQSSRSSPNKTFKNASMEAKHHEHNSSPLKRSITSPPGKLPTKPPKLRKLVPMEWKSQKGNGKY